MITVVQLDMIDQLNRFSQQYGRLLNTLSSMSGEIAIGWSGGFVDYAQGVADQLSGILGGMRLTHHSWSDQLRITLAYDHRHDGWEGGAIVNGLGSGILGFLESELSVRLGRYGWVGLSASFGASHIYMLTISARELISSSIDP